MQLRRCWIRAGFNKGGSSEREMRERGQVKTVWLRIVPRDHPWRLEVSVTYCFPFSASENGSNVHITYISMLPSLSLPSLSFCNSDGGIWGLYQAKSYGGFNKPGLPNYLARNVCSSPFMLHYSNCVSPHCIDVQEIFNHIILWENTWYVKSIKQPRGMLTRMRLTINH